MSFRKILFWTHLITGCAAGMVIFVMSVTGVLLAYQRQVIHWVDRDFRSVPPAANAPKLPIETILATAAQGRGTPSAITLHSDTASPAEISFGREQVLLADVYSGRVLGESSRAARSFFQTVENWHRWLAMSGEHRSSGRAVTGACNFAFLLLVVSGPFIWIPRKWSPQSIRAITWFRGGLSGKARDFNWHNVIGIWCAAPLFVIVLSGVVMSYPWANDLLYRITRNAPPAQGGGARGESDKSRAKAMKFDGWNLTWARAEQQVPGWRSLTLRPGRGPMVFTIDEGNGGRPDQRSQLTLDRRTAEVIRWEPFSAYNSGRRWRSWFRFVHTGEAGGIPGQTIAGAASAGTAVLVWTGICLALRRFVRWRGRTTAVASRVAGLSDFSPCGPATDELRKT